MNDNEATEPNILDGALKTEIRTKLAQLIKAQILQHYSNLPKPPTVFISDQTLKEYVLNRVIIMRARRQPGVSNQYVVTIQYQPTDSIDVSILNQVLKGAAKGGVAGGGAGLVAGGGAGAGVGAVIGIIGGPIGIAVGAALGGAIGAAVGGVAGAGGGAGIGGGVQKKFGSKEKCNVTTIFQALSMSDVGDINNGNGGDSNWASAPIKMDLP